MRILIADSQDRVRFALRVLVAQQPGLQVVGEASDGEGLLAQARITAPDLILVDWELPGLVEAGSLSALRNTCQAVQVVVLSGRPGVRRVALAVGADAFVSKGDPPERLLSVLRRCGEIGASGAPVAPVSESSTHPALKDDDADQRWEGNPHPWIPS